MEVVHVKSKPPSRALKRKHPRAHALPVPKRAKRAALDELPWHSVARPSEAGLDEYGDVLELEEVDGVDVVYETQGDNKVARFEIADGRQKAKSPVVADDSDVEDSPEQLPEPFVTTFDTQTLLPEWASFSLHPQLAATLHQQNFKSPTAIQARALPVASAGRDVIGVAETGSGKTLAYGLPILHHLLTTPRPAKAKGRRPVRALVLAPTRELALQVCNHLKACLADPIKKEDEEEETKGKKIPVKPPAVSVAPIVGGMSAQKQRRVLDRGVDVLVATPGRLWDILSQDDTLATQIKQLNFLVLDEADRMIQAGHFAELDNILKLTVRMDVPEEDPRDQLGDAATKSALPKNEHMQTFVFSATLSKDLQRNLKKRSKFKKAHKTSTLDDLLLRLDFRDSDPEIIDLSPEGGVVSTLQESKIECLVTDKDAYLYYFLLRYPGRTLVFLSAIDGIRRLAPLFELLQLKSFVLHSELQQKQRLKTLDRFKAESRCVLLATDIAARGLDVPSVDHVIHYQLPRSADTYVHRNGRTARARADGFALMLCAPDERRTLRALMGALGRTESELPELNVEHDILDKLRERIALARKIDGMQHRVKKENHERKWMKEAADALGVDVDSDVMSASEDEDDEERGAQKSRRKKRKVQEGALKAELKALLAQPVMARGVSAKYITSGSRPIAHDMLTGDAHDAMLGVKKADARSEVVHRKKKVKPKAEAKVEEEWSGVEDE
ncbi:DEAD-domain-containing protein [Exidia glandulosa HHB12029]|uniref:RNA helicase n=1 Tax=Exidia glandulosa HHB12029 TaxID=1314781 RepID=A0A166N2S4_EXIGL|nr:DEAD-domain-containing protein [Exidia glandulosa HHB12029]KZV81189.1 DEAD-domain-containing protein [Exidia glandulosa HHB12029]